MVPGSKERGEYLSERPIGTQPAVDDELPPCSSLPEGYRPFALGGTRDEAPYLTYLRSRGVTDHTVALYRMGYVDDGHLRRRVVIPSFDQQGMLNFWSARSIDIADPRDTFRYRLPVASKDIVSNEHMVDWSRPVHLVEGIFDEIALGPQAIALYGKFLPPTLALRLVERRPPSVSICLDSDALPEARGLMRRIIGYDIPCSLVRFDGKDPSAIDRSVIEGAIGESPLVTGHIGMMKEKLRMNGGLR